jgi:hypothetical protein
MTFPRFDPQAVLESAGRRVDAAMADVPQPLLESGTAMTPVDIYVLVDPTDGWQVAHLALDAFGTEMSDRFGSMRLSPPMEYEGRILLRVQSGVPSAAVGALLMPLECEVEAQIREVLGPDVEVRVSVAPADPS